MTYLPFPSSCQSRLSGLPWVALGGCLGDCGIALIRPATPGLLHWLIDQRCALLRESWE